jgi:uncharacterized protein (TIGR02246 family)
MMKRRSFLGGLSAGAVVAAPSLAVADGEIDPDIVAAVKAVVQRYVEARESSNAQAIGTLFTDDADQHVSDGTWRRGREALVQGMLESSRRNPARRTITVESLRLLSADVALADGPYVHKAGEAGGQDRPMWTSIVLVRASGTWRIAAIRNMLPAPAG